MRFLSLALATILSLSTSALADDGCFDAEPVVDRTEIWDFTASPRSDFYLPTRNVYGLFPTRAAAHFSLNESGALNVAFDHQLPPDMMGIQYTVHQLEVEVGGATFHYDFTRGCTEPGLSFFPRETAEIPAIKLPLPAGNAPLRIRVWGHL
jgi:hypothetical protein